MTKRVLALFAIALLMGADTPADADLKKMQGEWKFESAQNGAEVAPAEVLARMSVTVEGKVFAINDSASAREEKAEVVLDPSKTPAIIDIKPKDREIDKGIYKLDGDRLMLCWSKAGGERPTDFTAKAKGQVLFVLKRVKK